MIASRAYFQQRGGPDGGMVRRPDGGEVLELPPSGPAARRRVSPEQSSAHGAAARTSSSHYQRRDPPLGIRLRCRRRRAPRGVAVLFFSFFMQKLSPNFFSQLFLVFDAKVSFQFFKFS